MGEQGRGSRRRKRPTGSIETLNSGSLRVRVYAGVDKLSGRKLYLTKVVPAGPNASDQAEEIRDGLVRQVEQGRQPKTDATVAQLLERYLAEWDGSESFRRSLQGYVRNHVNPFVGDIKARELDLDVLDSFYRELKRCRDHCDGRSFIQHRTKARHECDHRCMPHECDGLGATTIRHIHFLLSGAYNRAKKRWKWVTDNPMGDAEPPAAPPPTPKPPTARQAVLIINEAWRDQDWGALIWVAMTTGARRGELCALRWNDIDFAPGEETMWIGRAIKKGKRGWVEGSTKTHQQRRVALDPETVLILRELLERVTARAEVLGLEVAEDAFVFSPGPDNFFYRPDTLTQRYDRMARRLKIRTTLHKLRHFSATELIRAGVDIRTVAGRIGHGGGGTTTLKVYAAFVSEADQRAAGKFLTRMPQRPAPSDPDHRAKIEPRYPYERIAATLYEEWRTGQLVAGTELTVNHIAEVYSVAVGTAHRVMTLLQRWNMVLVSTGKPSLVLPFVSTPTGDSDTAEAQRPEGARQEAVQQAAVPVPVLRRAPEPPLAPVPAPKGPEQPLVASSETVSEVAAPSRELLKLDLIHLTTTVRTMTVHADPADFDLLERLMLDAVRRIGGDLSHIGEYEMAVHLAGNTQPIATVVVAA